MVTKPENCKIRLIYPLLNLKMGNQRWKWSPLSPDLCPEFWIYLSDLDLYKLTGSQNGWSKFNITK